MVERTGKENHHLEDHRLAKLTKRQRITLISRAQGYTLRQLGDLFGVSVERARQILRKAEAEYEATIGPMADFPPTLRKILVKAGYNSVADVTGAVLSGKLGIGDHRIGLKRFNQILEVAFSGQRGRSKPD